MRRGASLLVTAALLMAAAPPPPIDARNDARDVLEAVVRSQTAAYARSSYAGQICVQARVDRPSVTGGWRDPGHDLLMGWRGVDEDGEPRLRQPALAIGHREAIREALRAATAASTQRRWLNQVMRNWVAAPLQFCTSGEYRSLSFHSPVIVGDVAFVSVDLMCPLCGHGASVALRRTSRGWAIVAWRNNFMS